VRREDRTWKEEVSDRILLLYLINKSNDCGDVDGDTKLQKLVFLSERDMIDSKIKGFDFYFFKFIHGPFSRQLENDMGVIEDWGAYLPDEHILTSAGRKVVELIPEIWSRNIDVTSKIDRIQDTFADKPLRSILNYVYNLEHPFYKPERKIRDLKKLTPILYKMKEEKASTSFTITESELETIDILLDFDEYSHLIDSDEEPNESIPYPGV
jgi:hypothetical protein